jgi:hypothetical protein
LANHEQTYEMMQDARHAAFRPELGIFREHALAVQLHNVAQKKPRIASTNVFYDDWLVGEIDRLIRLCVFLTQGQDFAAPACTITSRLSVPNSLIAVAAGDHEHGIRHVDDPG